ncbi:M15 family metallopeptidase [uncultured Pseudoteredinibacter sp.]|uniref:M15 family metallopeptidase n=1 Tax=uncultured Pseudoteredinibacter sp. TaxID=1641701 RepID=UPI002636A90C|nr:M15 family metallopeptidase [uncultured Pseudoteredinibacter sp.]
MASRDVEDLSKDVLDKAKLVQRVMSEVGIDLLIYCTLRSLEEQARLYRQSRSWATIRSKILDLRDSGHGYLAQVLEEVGPCSGPHVTNAAPGESWHNYAEAWDAVPLIGGKPAWNYFDAKEQWEAYGECVRQSGMFWAGDWTNFREYPHAQLRLGNNPLSELSPDESRQSLTDIGLLKT